MVFPAIGIDGASLKLEKLVFQAIGMDGTRLKLEKTGTSGYRHGLNQVET